MQMDTVPDTYGPRYVPSTFTHILTYMYLRISDFSNKL